MIIVDTPENNVSTYEKKFIARNFIPILLSNILHSFFALYIMYLTFCFGARKQSLVLESYTRVVDSWIIVTRCYKHYFTEKFVNELNYLKEN